MISFEGVGKRFGDFQVLRDVSGTVEAGKVVVVCGRSGSGKTTLIRTVNRLEEIDAGRVLVDGVEVHARGTAVNRMRRSIGFVFQQFSLFPHLSVRDNIALAPSRLLGMSSADASALADRLLGRVGLAGKADAMPERLSGGQKQRVAIARAIAMNPRVLLLDEPTSALDPEMVGEVLDVIGALSRDGMTMMCVTHEMGFARDVADTIWFMDQGQLLEVASPGEFFDSPVHPRAQGFVASLSRLGA
jgi:polar amino acid transport system ATP-binding protein